MKKSKRVIELQKAILEILKENPGLPVNRKEISQALGITKKDYYLFMDSLVGLAKEGTIIHVRKRHYAFPQQAKQWIGELRVTRVGFGFVYVESEDVEIFVSQPNLNTAFDRDIVEVQLYSASRGKRLEGFVKRIVKRFREYVVGTYHKTEYYDYVVPDDQKITRDILVHQENSLNAEDGQKVLVRFDKWEKNQHNPEGTVVEILGDENTPGLDVVSVAYSYNIPVKFKDTVEKEALKISNKITKKDLKDRLD
jgi:ribonuclease R